MLDIQRILSRKGFRAAVIAAGLVAFGLLPWKLDVRVVLQTVNHRPLRKDRAPRPRGNGDFFASGSPPCCRAGLRM